LFTFQDGKRHIGRPIEFINNKWYYLDWDDTAQFNGYWVYPDQELPPGTISLLELDVPGTSDIRTPTAGASQYRERAESASTQADPPDTQAVKDEDDPVDTNPALTEDLAAQFEDNPVFEDIAETFDPPGDRSHYLPTTVPPAIRTLRPVGINPPLHSYPPPLRIRSGREETIGATVDPKDLQNAIRLDGSLKGKVPDFFDGDRTKTQKFLSAFNLFWMNNEDNSHMRNPYKRSTYFLGLFNGAKVDDWVEDQIEQLRNKTTRRSDPIAKSDETLWIDLVDSFGQAFAHTGKVEQARMQLAKLEMDGNLIDEYIAKFENLLRKAEIPRDEVGSLQKFKDGLKRYLLQAILRRDKWPETLDEWQDQARREVRRHDIVKEALGGEYKSPLTHPKQSRWNSFAQQFKSTATNKKRDGVVPMEIDAAYAPSKAPSTQGPGSVKETRSDRLKRLGKCFGCEQTGHIRSQCPTNPSAPKQSFPQKARSAQIEQVEKQETYTKAEATEIAKEICSMMLMEQGF